MVKLVAVAALGADGGIGRRGGLPWRLPGDLAHFRRVTLGKVLVVGRRTFEGLGGGLPGREMVVVSRRGAGRVSGGGGGVGGVWAAADLAAAEALARERAGARGVGEVCVIGGGEVFAGLLGRCAEMVLTRVEAEGSADVWFPEFAAAEWRRVGFTRPVRHPRDECGYVFERWRRV